MAGHWCPARAAGLCAADRTDGGLALGSLIKSTWEAFIAGGLCLGLLVLFREGVTDSNRLVQKMALNAYGVYIIHIFVVLALQMAMLALPPLLKFGLVTAVAVPVCFLLVDCLRCRPAARAVL
jgi:peptidoglycan/LPS O-acetylase OafA/YrhL